MLINKEDFVKYIESVQEQFKYYCELGKTLNDNFKEKIYEVFERPHAILSEVLFTKEQQDWINWWLWDAPDDSKIVGVAHNGNRVDYNLLTSAELYDFLILHYPTKPKPKRKHVSALEGIYKRSTKNV